MLRFIASAFLLYHHIDPYFNTNGGDILSANAHLVRITLSDEDISTLVAIAKHIGSPANNVIKRIIYQANDSPFFCSAYNKPIRHLNPKAATCQPFPYACNSCPLACFEE